MLPFQVTLVPGESPFRQIVYAATKAILSGVLLPGEAFPSGRELSESLRINPNTAQKVISQLTRDGLLEVRPGIGTFVAAGRDATAAERGKLLSRDVEQLVVKARQLGLTMDDVTEAVVARWKSLFDLDDDSTR